MRILVAGDTHGNSNHTDWVIQKAMDLGIRQILQVGDFGFWTHRHRGVRFLDRISRKLLEAQCTMTVVRGNHDNTALILQDHGHDVDANGLVNVRAGLKLAPDGLVWEWGGKGFISLGGAYSLDKENRLYHEKLTGEHGEHWFPDEEMTDEDMEKHIASAGQVDVIVAHDRPACARLDLAYIPDPGLVPNPRRLDKAIQRLRPVLYVHGHLHIRYEDKVKHDDGVCRVVGLSSDPKTSASGRPEDSVWILDTDDL